MIIIISCIHIIISGIIIIIITVVVIIITVVITLLQVVLARAEALAKAQFAGSRDAHDCALMYVALKKKQLLLVHMLQTYFLSIIRLSMSNSHLLIMKLCLWTQHALSLAPVLQCNARQKGSTVPV